MDGFLVRMGTIQFGQTRSIVVPFNLNPDGSGEGDLPAPHLEAVLEYLLCEIGHRRCKWGKVSVSGGILSTMKSTFQSNFGKVMDEWVASLPPVPPTPSAHAEFQEMRCAFIDEGIVHTERHAQRGSSNSDTVKKRVSELADMMRRCPAPDDALRGLIEISLANCEAISRQDWFFHGGVTPP